MSNRRGPKTGDSSSGDQTPKSAAPGGPEIGLDPTFRLRRGNAFQEIVQADFIANSKGGGVQREFHIDLSHSTGMPMRQKTGRVDIWVDILEDDQCAVFEIKATDWDLITPGKVRRNIYRHHKQLCDYAQKYVACDGLTVTYGLIYPFPPETEGLREEVEELAMTTYLVPVYWYTELNPTFDRRLLSDGGRVDPSIFTLTAEQQLPVTTGRLHRYLKKSQRRGLHDRPLP
jgi:hypothetical protein